MAVESVTYINNLDPSLPSGGDSIAEGDDHIRNVKKGIKTTFPNVTGAVTATHQQLNETTKIAAIESALEGYSRDELGGAKYSSKDNNTGWTFGNVSSITQQSSATYRINFSPALPDYNYVCVITPQAVDGKPLIGFVTSALLDSCTISFREFDSNGAMSSPSDVGFSCLIQDAHDK